MELIQFDAPDFCTKPILVLGCGNVFFGDDGFGCAVVDAIREKFAIPDDVCLVDAGTSVRRLLFTICLSPVRPGRILVIDAFDAGRAPGEIFAIDPCGLPAIKCDDFSMHQIPTSNMLRELQDECGVDVTVLACQTAHVPTEMIPGLSASVQSAVQRAAEWVMNDFLDMQLVPRRGESWAISS